MRKTLPILTLGVVAVLSLVFALYVVFGPFDPEAEFRRMIGAMSQLETVRQESGFSWTRQHADRRSTTTLYSRGQIGLQTPEDIEHGTQFRVVHIADGKRAGDIVGELRHVDDMTYLTYEPPGPDVEGVTFDEEKTWVSFDRGALPAWGALLPGVQLPLFEEREDVPAWTRDGIAQIREILPRADVLNVSFNGVTDKADGEEARVLDATFDGKALRAFLFAFYKAKYQRALTDADRIWIERLATGLERLTMRMWIGADTHHLYRLQIAGALPAEPGENRLLPVDAILRFSDFNAPFEVTPPDQNVIGFEEVLQRTFGILPEARAFDPMQRRGETLVKKSAQLPIWGGLETTDDDGDGLDNISEAFFGTNPDNPDTDGDGMSDGDEVSNGRNPRGGGSLFGFGLRE